MIRPSRVARLVRRPPPASVRLRNGGGGHAKIVWKEKMKKFMFLCQKNPVRCVKIASQYKNRDELVKLIMQDPIWTRLLLETLAQDDEIQEAFQENKLARLPRDQASLEKMARHKQQIEPYIDFLVSKFTSE
jgi:hypothetical protein